MKLLIVIPAYNEAENIQRVVDNLKHNYPQYDYIVVNDGSRDNTGAICREQGYPLLDLPVNLGLSGAFQAGIRYAYKKGYDAAIQFDGDGQHEPAYIAAMAQTMEEHHCDIVIGSRFYQKEKPKTLRMLGSNLIGLAIRLTTGKRLTDPTSGMRLYNRAMLKLFSQQMNYTPEPDTISYLIKSGAKIEEVQVEMYQRIAGSSYLTVMRSIRYMLNMFVSILFIQAFRPKVVK